MGIGSKLKVWLFGSHEGKEQKPAPEPIAHERHITVYEDVQKPPVMKPLEDKKSRAKKSAKKRQRGNPKKR